MGVMHFRLPNAVAGRPYEGLLSGLLPAAECVVEGIDALGLEFDAVNMRIHGVPNQAGEFRIRFRLSGEADADPQPFAETLLIINPDPQKLWISLDPPADAPFQKPMERLERIQSGLHTVIAASKRGRSHAREGKFREDDFLIWRHPGGIWSLAIVADGAGSAHLSRQGVSVACAKAFAHVEVQDLQSLSDEIAQSGAASSATRGKLYNFLCGAAFEAHKAIRQEASALGEPARDFACTFSMLLFGDLPQGKFFAAFGIGDSPVAVVDAQGIPHVLHVPEEGEFSGQTMFLTQQELFSDANALLARIHTILLPQFTAAFAMSDGIYDAWFETRARLGKADAWAAFLIELAAKGVMDGNALDEGKLLEWMDFWSIGNHDDRTLVILA